VSDAAQGLFLAAQPSDIPSWTSAKYRPASSWVMQLRHRESSDPIGRALECADRCAKDGTPNHPLTPELFWEDLKRDGFYFVNNPPESDEHGRFFAHLVLDHAVALGRITGNTFQHHYWAIQ
jgi:hypothetical protein